MPGRSRLLCADAIPAMTALPESSVDLIVADPPYNLGKDYGNNHDWQAWQDYEQFTRNWLAQAVRLLKPTGSIYVFMGVQFISNLFLLMQREYDLRFNGWITWHYTQGMGRKKGFSPRHEDILYFTKADAFTFNLDEIRIPQKYYRQRNNMSGANPGDVWQFSHVHYSNPQRLPHPTQKPEALIERMIRASSNPGDLVLDPFVGSGTTCRVAQVLGRECIGIDINPDYIAMTQRRLEIVTGPFDSVDPRIKRTPQNVPGAARDTERRPDTPQESTSELVDMLMNRLSHEVNSPLSAIQGFAQLLAEQPAAPPEKREKWASYVFAKSQVLSQLMENLTKLVEVQHDQVMLRLEAVNLGDLVREAVKQLSAAAPQRYFDLRLPDEAIMVRVDAAEMLSVVVKLLRYAHESSPPDQIIPIQMSHSGKETRLTVADFGQPVPPEQHESVFEPFSAEPGGGIQPGKGLWLPLARALVELHHGRMWIEAGAAGENVFVITLPISPET